MQPSVSMPALKAFIFDLDGTLIDSLADLAGAVNRMLAEYGFPEHPVAHYPQWIGEGMRELVTRALPEERRADEALITQCLLDYRKYYADHWHDQTQVYPGVKEVLVALKNSGRRVGCISNKTHAFTVLCCEHFFPEGTFEFVLGQREGVPRKPEPMVAHEAALLLDLSTPEMVYVGDSGLDMVFARRAGMHAVGVSWGFRSVEELRDCGADCIIQHPRELLALP
jgi:phosphoglycolate phosphatase